MPMELKVYGNEQLMARLVNLQKEVLDKACEVGTKEVAEKIRDTAKNLVAVDTGSIKAKHQASSLCESSNVRS